MILGNSWGKIENKLLTKTDQTNPTKIRSLISCPYYSKPHLFFDMPPFVKGLVRIWKQIWKRWQCFRFKLYDLIRSRPVRLIRRSRVLHYWPRCGIKIESTGHDWVQQTHGIVYHIVFSSELKAVHLFMHREGRKYVVAPRVADGDTRGFILVYYVLFVVDHRTFSRYEFHLEAIFSKTSKGREKRLLDADVDHSTSASDAGTTILFHIQTQWSKYKIFY